MPAPVEVRLVVRFDVGNPVLVSPDLHIFLHGVLPFPGVVLPKDGQKPGDPKAKIEPAAASGE